MGASNESQTGYSQQPRLVVQLPVSSFGGTEAILHSSTVCIERNFASMLRGDVPGRATSRHMVTRCGHALQCALLE